MPWLSEHWLHLTFVLAYLAILVRHGWVGRRRVHDLEDYLVAGRRLGGGVVALSFYATFMSTNTFIGAAGKSWEAWVKKYWEKKSTGHGQATIDPESLEE